MKKSSQKISDRQRRLKYTMRRALWGAVIAAVLAAMVAADHFGVFGQAAREDRNTYHGKTFRVVKVVDGDTLDIDLPDGKYPSTRIRLWGVNTPETVAPNSPVEYFGPEASAFTHKVCDGQQVRIELESGTSTRGKFGRLLAWVFLPDGSLLNRRIVEEGYGYADPRFFDHHLKRELLTLQGKARKEARGLWKNVKPGQLPPYVKKGSSRFR